VCVFFLLPVVLLVVEITTLRSKIMQGSAILWAGGVGGGRDCA